MRVRGDLNTVRKEDPQKEAISDYAVAEAMRVIEGIATEEAGMYVCVCMCVYVCCV
jgi:hypothetical protein